MFDFESLLKGIIAFLTALLTWLPTLLSAFGGAS